MPLLSACSLGSLRSIWSGLVRQDRLLGLLPAHEDRRGAGLPIPLETITEVQEQLKTALYNQQQGKLLTARRQTVQQFLTHRLEDVHKPAVRVRTYVRY
jgi:hypothetical protein